VIVSPAALPQILADEQMVKQMLLNLLSNSIKFTPRNGTIAVVAGAAADGAVFLRVEDSGVGIAAADVSRALQPFVQIDSALNRKYPGTGLGLALVKSMIELHGGGLEITSLENSGTVVTLRFPAARTLAPDDDAAAEPKAASA
jgi:signal transduction histidine kinase